MKKYFKYVLAVAILIVACATFALADGPTVATVNGQPYDSLSSAFSASLPGDSVVLVSDTSFSGMLSIPNGVQFTLPKGITLSTDTGYIYSDGNLELYGRITRSGVGTDQSLIYLHSGVTNFYGELVSTPQSGYGFVTNNGSSPGTRLNIYGGTIIGLTNSIRATSTSGDISVYGGRFEPMFTPSTHIQLMNGAEIRGSYVSWGGLAEIGQIVSSALNWITLFCASIVANKLLLIFMIFFMGFAGIGLIKRIIR